MASRLDLFRIVLTNGKGKSKFGPVLPGTMASGYVRGFNRCTPVTGIVAECHPVSLAIRTANSTERSA